MDVTRSKKELSVLVFQAMNRRDFSELDPFFDEEVCFDFPGVKLVEGRRKFHIFLKALLIGYPVLEFSVEEIICSEKASAVVWSNKGFDVDDKPYDNRGITLIRFRDDRIVFVSDYFKDTSFVK